MAVAPSVIRLDPTADSQLNDFSLVTLKERYMLPQETSPQQALARASAAFADNADHAQRLYDYVSKGWFMFATPLLANGGSARGLPISCFLTSIEDSRESISDHYDEVIWLSSMGGGIGSYYGNLRSAGEKTAKGSESTGMMPFAAVDDRLILAVSQGGTRRGSNAVYTDVRHPEAMEFTVGRKPNGGDQNRKFTNLHNALNITDDFMEAVRDDLIWEFRSPKDGSVRGTVQARDFWKLIIETRMQTGEPYLHFIDTSNRKMQPAQKALGLKVRQSNLCVSGETEILTSAGYLPMAALAGREVDVWNGLEWSNVKIEQTADSAEMVRVWFEDGGYLDCTPEHRFYLANGTVVPAAALRPDTRLEQSTWGLPPTIHDEAVDQTTRAAAYTAGWTTFAGFEDANRLATHVPTGAGDDIAFRLTKVSVDSQADEDGMLIRFEPKSINAGHAPFSFGIERKKLWLAGALDAAGTWVEFEGVRYLTLGTTDEDLIREMRLLALEAGIPVRIRLTDTMHVFMIEEWFVQRLAAGGYIVRYETLEGLSLDPGLLPSDAAKVSTVVDVHPIPYPAPTFCATEPKRGRLVFNGYVTGNCTEIMLHSGPDHLGKERTAVCCLSSVNLEMFWEWRDHPTFIEDLFRMLDNALQVFIDEAPPQMHKAVYSAQMERSVGLGAFGLHSLFKRQNVAFESDEARNLNMLTFTHLRLAADKASLILGAERGSPPDMAGTGERFAHKLALAPNASSSIISRSFHKSGVSPATEPDRANAFLHKTLSGSFPVKSPYLQARLAELGQDTEEVWKTIVANEGSAQHLDFLTDHDRSVHKTAMEIDQKVIVRLAADRSDLICQGQSVNIFLPHDADAEELTKVHYYAWEWGVKSLYYLRSDTPNRAENTNSAVARIVIEEVANDALPVEDEECFACQG